MERQNTQHEGHTTGGRAGGDREYFVNSRLRQLASLPRVCADSEPRSRGRRQQLAAFLLHWKLAMHSMTANDAN